MSKQEFLEQLKQALEGEVGHEIIEKNIRYYDQYISSQSERMEDVLERLGNPRLIAKTIIETEKAAGMKKHDYRNLNNDSGYRNYNDEADNDSGTSNKKNTFFFTPLKWYHKLIFFMVILLLIFTIVVVGRIIIGFLFAFGVPILLLLLLLSLFRKR